MAFFRKNCFSILSFVPKAKMELIVEIAAKGYTGECGGSYGQNRL